MLRGIGTIVGIPVAGMLMFQDRWTKASSVASYEYCTIFTGVLLAIASVCLLRTLGEGWYQKLGKSEGLQSIRRRVLSGGIKIARIRRLDARC